MPCRTAQNLLRKVWNLSNFAPRTTRRHSALLIYHFFSLSPFSSSQASRETELYTGMPASASSSSTALPLAVSSWGFYFSFETPRGCLWRSVSSPTTAGRAAPGRGSGGRRSSRQRSEVTLCEIIGESHFQGIIFIRCPKACFFLHKTHFTPFSTLFFSFDPPTYLALH